MPIDRRMFLKSAAATGLGRSVHAMIPAHNWDKYDFGSGPAITDRLNQGPFPEYPPEADIPETDVVMATTRTSDVVPNSGQGLAPYTGPDQGRDEIKGDDLGKPIEALPSRPLGKTLYFRPPWRD